MQGVWISDSVQEAHTQKYVISNCLPVVVLIWLNQSRFFFWFFVFSHFSFPFFHFL
ncbi:hypothetical protein AXF42_Ash003609 [Apostasia shenzhenica]|uniref:Uncharacterized protein n=1 Tax=Apostasia shenzhenica TaxID=1088818 RepID=A0A2I0AHD4_9ASPA|nr:hypothetical protein AXF42_Ash003609 [Apostasia shenzhenica]